MWTTQIKALIYKTEHLLNSQETATGMLITVTETRLRSDSRELNCPRSLLYMPRKIFGSRDGVVIILGAGPVNQKVQLRSLVGP